MELSWPAVPKAVSYRLCRRCESADKTTTLYVGAATRFVIPAADKISVADHTTYRIEVLADGRDNYVTLVPYMELANGTDQGETEAVEAPGSDDDAPAWRLILRDDSEDREILRRVSTSRRFALDKSRLPMTHKMRMRFYAWDWQNAKWAELGGYLHFPLESRALRGQRSSKQELTFETAAETATSINEEDIWRPEIVARDAPVAQGETLVAAHRPIFLKKFAGGNAKDRTLEIQALEFPTGTPVFLSHTEPRTDAPQGIVAAADRRLSTLYVSKTLGQTWTALVINGCQAPLRRHFLTRAGTHIVQTEEPETLLLDSSGKILARAKAGAENWHGTCSIDEGANGTLMFAEYRATREPLGGHLHVWRSTDGGASWKQALSAPGRSAERVEGEIRHFHTCQADPFIAGRWYVTSGDATPECAIWISEDDGLSWIRKFPKLGKRDIREGEFQRYLRQTSFQIGERHLLWATDDNVNGGRSALVRCDKSGTALKVMTPLGTNLTRSFVRIDDDMNIAISEAKKIKQHASAFVLDAKGKVLTEARLKNTSRKLTGFTYSIASRAAVNGIFFTPTDGTTLIPDTTVLRWKVTRKALARKSGKPAAGKTKAPKPFAIVGKRMVNWFPANFVPRDNDLLVLLRPQRVGGISVRNLLCFIYGITSIYAYRMTPDYRHWPDLSEASVAGYKVYTGHAKYAPKDFTRRCLYLGLVREPAQRLVSLYRYIRARKSHTHWAISQEGDIEDFYRRVYALQPGYVSNLQAEFICGVPDAKQAIELVARDYLGVATLEYLDPFVAALATTLGWPPARMRHDNKAQSPQDFEITRGFLDFARQINGQDYALYEFVKKAWQQRGRP